MTALESLRGLVILDEIERRGDSFPVLRVLADRKPLRSRFLEMCGFDLIEVGVERAQRLWVREGFHAHAWRDPPRPAESGAEIS